MVVEALVRTVGAALEVEQAVELAMIFGSSARGTARPDSDVDVAVLGAAVDTLDLAAKLSLATGREVDVVDLSRAPIPLLIAILRDGIVAFERESGAEGRFRSRALAMLETDRPWYERMERAWLERVAERGILGRP